MKTYGEGSPCKALCEVKMQAPCLLNRKNFKAELAAHHTELQRGPRPGHASRMGSFHQVLIL